jgi:hypothetical protein
MRTAFGDAVKNLFLLYYENYLRRIEEEIKKPLKEFQMMPFEVRNLIILQLIKIPSSMDPMECMGALITLI